MNYKQFQNHMLLLHLISNSLELVTHVSIIAEEEYSTGVWGAFSDVLFSQTSAQMHMNTVLCASKH